MTLPNSHKRSCSTGHIWGEQWVHMGYALRSDPWDAHMTFPSPKSRGVWALPLHQLCFLSRSWLGNISVSSSLNAARNMGTFMIYVKTQNR